VAVQELFLTETAKLADVVLPAQAYTEREGTFTSGERRVQRFYPALPPRGEARADFAITAAIGKELGLELEGESPARLMDRLAASSGTFTGINYRRLAEVTEQWPIVTRSDLYYGGTGYENRQGLGTHLALNAPVDIPSAKGKSLRPDEHTLLSVPITRLYDRGITIFASEVLHLRTGEAAVILHPESARKLGLTEGEQVTLGGFLAKVRLDATVPASVALLPRSMGLPVDGPAVAELKKA
jgi:NADH-quinone oxidoreductase subunit G